MNNAAFLTKFFKTLNSSEPLHTEINPGKYYEVKVNREYAKPLNLVVEFSSWRESYLFTREKVCGGVSGGPLYLNSTVIAIFNWEIMVSWLYLGPEIEFSKSNQ